ncbi:MAG: hypothetical protein NZ551_00060 [Microscillaceae bacterium]|nr:hypothetical protein [Microscillaceae bacterium]MDW8459582.1 glycoside hydrolase family 43 C-terminal domain-containing protein [Cytophagales bacterium]
MKKNTLGLFISLLLLVEITFAQKIQEKDLVGKWSLIQKEWLKNPQVEYVTPDKLGHIMLVLFADKTCQLVYAQNPNQYKGTWQFDKDKNQITMRIDNYDYVLKIYQKIGNKLIFNAEDGNLLYGYEHYEKIE